MDIFSLRINLQWFQQKQHHHHQQQQQLLIHINILRRSSSLQRQRITF